MVCPPLRCDKDEGRSRAARGCPIIPGILFLSMGSGTSARALLPAIPCASVRRTWATSSICPSATGAGRFRRAMWRPTGRAKSWPRACISFMPGLSRAIRTGLASSSWTPAYSARARTFAAVRAVERGPLHAAVYTRGHVDHACGLPHFSKRRVRTDGPRRRSSGTGTSRAASTGTGSPRRGTGSSTRGSSPPVPPGRRSTTIRRSSTTPSTSSAVARGSS
jgi:hypothetical protein